MKLAMNLHMALSAKAKEAIKLGLSMVLVYGIAMQLGWENPFWAALTVATASVLSTGQSLGRATMRALGTAVGALVYGLVAVFIWPIPGVGRLNESAQKLVANQAKLFRCYRDRMSGSGTVEDPRPLRTAEAQLLTQVALALSSAEVDSPKVREVRHQWRRFYQQLTALREALDLWPQAFAEIQPLNLPRLLPNLDGLDSELDLRF